MVFDSDSSVRYLWSYDNYYRPKGETKWILDLKNNAGEGISEWGFNKNNSLYIFEPHISQIEILNEDCFIIQDEMTIESSQPLPDNMGTLTIIYGDYPAGTLKRIDVVYTSATADEGPSFFPPWPYWPE
jgi:hypothetical protein